jgi:hypothetical protein
MSPGCNRCNFSGKIDGNTCQFCHIDNPVDEFFYTITTAFKVIAGLFVAAVVVAIIPIAIAAIIIATVGTSFYAMAKLFSINLDNLERIWHGEGTNRALKSIALQSLSFVGVGATSGIIAGLVAAGLAAGIVFGLVVMPIPTAIIICAGIFALTTLLCGSIMAVIGAGGAGMLHKRSERFEINEDGPSNLYQTRFASSTTPSNKDGSAIEEKCKRLEKALVSKGYDSLPSLVTRTFFSSKHSDVKDTLAEIRAYRSTYVP